MNNDNIDSIKEKKNLKNIFNSIADEFSETRQYPWREVKEFIQNSNGDIAIDLGCGNGRHLSLLQKQFKIAIGLDFSKEMLYEAIEYSKKNKGKLVQGDMVFLPFKDSISDIVICIASLHHIPSKKQRLKVLENIYNLLKRKGRGLIGVWAIEHSRFNGIRNEIKKNNGDFYIPWKSSKETGENTHQRFYHIYQKKEFRELIKSSSLNLDKIEVSSGNYYGFVSSN